MKFKSPIMLKDTIYPTCINLCACPDNCKIHCQDKLDAYDTRLYLAGFACFIFIGVVTFLIYTVLTLPVGG